MRFQSIVFILKPILQKEGKAVLQENVTQSTVNNTIKNFRKHTRNGDSPIFGDLWGPSKISWRFLAGLKKHPFWVLNSLYDREHHVCVTTHTLQARALSGQHLPQRYSLFYLISISTSFGLEGLITIESARYIRKSSDLPRRSRHDYIK